MNRRLMWFISRAWQYIDHLMLVAIALIFLAIGLKWQVLKPLSEHLLQLKQEIATVKTQLGELSNGHNLAQSAVKKDAVVAEFLAFLPSVLERNKQLSLLQQLIQKQALTGSRVDYQETVLASLPVHKMTARFTVVGEDTQLAVFLNLLLRQLPNCAIERLSFDKKEPNSNTSQLTIEAVLFFREGEV